MIPDRTIHVQWMVAPLVPLEKTEPDGSRRAVLCWQVSGITLVHPDRVEQWLESIRELNRGGVHRVIAERLERFPDHVLTVPVRPPRFIESPPLSSGLATGWPHGIRR